MYNGHAFNCQMNYILYIFSTIYNKNKYAILVFDNIIINDFDKYVQRLLTNSLDTHVHQTQTACKLYFFYRLK